MSIKKGLLITILFLLMLAGITKLLSGIDSDQNKDTNGTYLSDSDSAESGANDAKIKDNGAANDGVDLVSKLGIDKDAWYMRLVNIEHPLSEDLDIELATISDDIQVDARILNAINAYLSAGRDEGLNLFACSGYRSITYQTGLFERRVTRWMNTGLEYDAAVEAAATSVAYPGTSEHHIGLAVDIICNEYTSLDSGFGDTAAGKWLKEHCAEYGFILRYPEDKTDITGFVYEPWHFRYVGVEAATYIMENDICFEEFWDLID